MAASRPNPLDGRGRPDDVPASNADPTAAALHAITERLDILANELRTVQAVVHHLCSQPSACATLFIPLSQSSIESIRSSTAPTLQLHLFGPFEALLNNQPLHRRHIGKGWMILKILAARPHEAVHREVLIETLWPQVDPAIANNRLRVAIHHLRSGSVTANDGEARGVSIEYHDSCYQLAPALEIWSDVESFRTAWRAGMRAEHAGQEALAVDLYRQAIRLYRGDFLAEDPYEEWTLAPREELRDIYLTILDRLGRYALHAGDFASAQAHWRTLLRHDPWREDIYRQMIASCAVNGQRCQALQWYELCRQALSDQLGLPPELETTQLIEHILAGEEFCAQRFVD